MVEPRRVEVPPRPVAHLLSVIGAERLERLRTTTVAFRAATTGRTVWNINSTAVGGGVAEMLQVVCGYVADLGIDIRWLTIEGDEDFFALTKRLHNRIHGQAGDGRDISDADGRHYADVLAANADRMADIRPGDLVLLHDPQTAGLAAPLSAAGAVVVWRCHIGLDRQTPITEGAWAFLRPHLAAARGYVFSRRTYVPPWISADRAWIIPPSIDPFSAKNQPMDDGTVAAILSRIGVLGEDPGANGTRHFVRRDGTTGEVTRRAVVVADELPSRDRPLVLQVSRWDRLKDMAGVMQGFVAHTARDGDGVLVLAGPAVADVTDDPEGREVYLECVSSWRRLPADLRRRVMLVTLPLDDVDENAAMVNALQRHASVWCRRASPRGSASRSRRACGRHGRWSRPRWAGFRTRSPTVRESCCPTRSTSRPSAPRCAACWTSRSVPRPWVRRQRRTSRRTSSATCTCSATRRCSRGCLQRRPRSGPVSRPGT